MSSIPRVFLTPAHFAGGPEVDLPHDAAHHLRTVLRMRAGEAVTLLDGAGLQYDATLTEVAPGRVCAQFGAARPCETEPPYEAIVCQALPKTTEKLEQVLQHGTELGATAFAVFASARSVAKLDSGKADNKLERWRKIVHGAAEQAGRGRIPSVAWSGKAPTITPETTVLILHEKATRLLRDALAEEDHRGAFVLVVGPEGGFTDDEVARWTDQGALAVCLGPRVLRTETAALAALAQLAYHFER